MVMSLSIPSVGEDRLTILSNIEFRFGLGSASLNHPEILKTVLTENWKDNILLWPCRSSIRHFCSCRCRRYHCRFGPQAAADIQQVVDVSQIWINRATVCQSSLVMIPVFH
jgi:hypothetical protein